MLKRDWNSRQNRNPKSILVLRLRYLGDIVRLTPVLHNLRLAFPEARIGVVCEDNYAAALTTNTDVDELLLMPRRSEGESPLGYLYRYLKFIRNVRKAKWQVGYDYQRNPRGHLFWRLSGIPEVRQDGTYCSHKKNWPTNYHISRRLTDPAAHVADRYLSFLQAYGIPTPCRDVFWITRPEDHAAARKWITQNDNNAAQTSQRTIILHPGSRVLPRQWPPERFAELITQLAAKEPLHFIITSGPTEREQVHAIRTATHVPLTIIDEPLDLPVLAALFAEADLFIGHDSGPMHIATATGTPVVALCGSQDISQWYPREVPHRILQAPQPCNSNCLMPDKCQPEDSYNNYCVRRLNVDIVLKACQELLEQITHKNRQKTQP